MSIRSSKNYYIVVNFVIKKMDNLVTASENGNLEKVIIALKK